MLQCTYCSGPPLKKPKVTEMLQPDDDSLRLALAEVRDLQRTVVVLRSELELSHNERQHAVQDALSFAHSEISQLRDTVADIIEFSATTRHLHFVWFPSRRIPYRHRQRTFSMRPQCRWSSQFRTSTYKSLKRAT